MKILFNGYKNLFDGSNQGVAGGPRLFTLQLTDRLKKHHHRFIGFVAHSKINMAKGSLIERYPAPGGEWVQATLRLNLNRILNSKTINIRKYTEAPIQKLSKIIAAENPDVVLLNGFSIGNWYILHAAHRAKIPIIVSHHGLWFKETPEVIANPKPSTLKLIRRMEKDTFKLADHQIFLNDYSKKIFEKEYKISTRGKSSIIPVSYNPLFLNKRLPKKPSHQIKKVGFVARWDAIKNPQKIYELALEAKKQKKQWEFYAVLQMNKTKGLKHLRTKFASSVRVIPPMPPERLKKFYQSMDILLLPSRFDTAGAVVVEAALQNRGTLISPEVGFVNEYRTLGMKEWIHDFINPKITLEYIEKMIDKTLPQKFIVHLQQAHRSDKILTQYENILHLLARKGKS